MIIFTASIGREMAPNRAWPGHDMICFSDVKPAAPWQWIPITPKGDPTRQVRKIKLLPWEFLEDWDQCLWVDANMELLRDPQDMPGPLAIHTHRDRDCIFDEAQKCIEYGKDDPDLIARQIERYADHPKHWGLWENGVIYRENTPEVRALFYDLWAELEANSRRDQISLPVVLRKHGMRPNSLGKNVWDGSKWVRLHRKKKLRSRAKGK